MVDSWLQYSNRRLLPRVWEGFSKPGIYEARFSRDRGKESRRVSEGSSGHAAWAPAAFGDGTADSLRLDSPRSRHTKRAVGRRWSHHQHSGHLARGPNRRLLASHSRRYEALRGR